jgi:hypothetical protein
MGRILTLEPDAEVRKLLRQVVVRLGHEALGPGHVPTRAPGSLDAVFLEPTWAPALELARGLRKRAPTTW